jgi:tetratricopeptide (TPR) repeat protein
MTPRTPAIAVTTLLGLALLTAPAADPAARPEPPGERLTSRARPAAPAAKAVAVGEEVRTDIGQRRRLLLADGSVVYVNGRAEVKVTGERRLRLSKGDIFVDVAPGGKDAAAFTVTTPDREVTCNRGAFSASIVPDPGGKDRTGIIVARGRVKVSGVGADVRAGQQSPFIGDKVIPAPRVSSAAGWARDLMAAAEAPLVPASQYGGGALVAVDPEGQQAKLSLRKYHIDVSIEDGFARTTIDQTYFNHTASRLEGTFYFPLPPDASLSRLAMYVAGQRMEGGMVERDFGRQVYEKIVTSQRDPALLEWVDGSTFKMRVFPLEARQEKRVILSYVQKLPSLDEQQTYRFPAGHSLETVRDWSFHARVKGGADFGWECASHRLNARKDAPDLLLDVAEKDARPNRDVVLTLADPSVPNTGFAESVRFSSFEQDGQKYLMLRYRPALVSDNLKSEISNRNWVFLFESSGDRDPLLARTQIEIIRGLLANADADDTFTVLAAGTRVRPFADKPLPVTPENVKAALAFLESSHLIGALDLGRALAEAEPFLKAAKGSHLVHVGSGVAAMGERHDDVLAKRLPDGVRYVGVGVGRRWNRSLMKQAAERSGGYFTQINPDEPVSWRAFDLAATLNTPRLLDVTVSDKAGKATFLTFTNMAAQGEELCAVARVGAGETLPEMVAVRGRLAGAAFARDLPVKGTAPNVGHLPRTWAKLEIERLLASLSRESPASARDEIVALSKAMYVMTPFTSLLVLENEDLYRQYKVDRGRKDHWAMYDCPEKIAVVYDPLPGMPADPNKPGKPSALEVMKTLELRGDPEARERRRQLAGQMGGGGFAGSSGGGGRGGFFPDSNPKRTVEDVISDQLGAEYAIELGQSQAASLAFLSRRTSPTKRLEDARRKDITGEERAMIRRMGVNLSTPQGEMLARRLLSETLDVAEASPDGPAINAFSPARPVMPRFMAETDYQNAVSLSRLPRDLEENPARRALMFGAGINADASLTGSQQDFGGSESLLYQRPHFAGDDRLFFDLVCYCPGMDSSRSDLLAVLEAEAAALPMSRPGTIDEGARRLFENARPQGWQTVTFPAEGDQPALGITFDGTGRYAYERTLPPGIRERVVCDGSTLQHLYPDLGLGARRNISRFHRLEFARSVPWAIPSPDDLARGADVKLIAERTVAVVPHGSDRKDADGKPIPYATVQYLFAEDGRLTERRIVEMPANKVRYCQIFGADGTITVRDGDGKELSVVKAALREGKQPDLKPDTKDLVVLPLPYRDLATTRKALGIEKKQPNEFTFEEARAVLAAEFGIEDRGSVRQVCDRAFFPRDQKQLGLYVLQAACGANLDSDNVDVLDEHMHEPLAQYLALYSSPVLRKHASQWAVGSGQFREGFLQHLAVTHALYQRWSNGKALGATDDKRREERDRALDYVRRSKGTAFGWGLLCLMKDRADEDENNKKDVRDTHAALAEAWPLFRDVPALSYAAEYEHARSLWKAGKHTEARQRFVDLYETTLKAGGLPRIDGEFRQALVGEGPEADLWGGLMRKTAAALVDGKHRAAVLALAAQCRQVGDEAMATALLGTALDGIKDGKERQRMTLAAIDFLMDSGQYAEADRLLRSLLDDAEMAKRADLWRLAMNLARKRDQQARQFECLERALDAEYRDLPEVIDLRSVRDEYDGLLRHYQRLADALESLGERPPAGFAAKVVRTADRWRALDPEADGACELAGRILRTVGERELVWDYLTTPVARRPNESGPWLALAGTLSRTGELDLADRAYAAAFEAEPTGANILWERAQNLRQSGKLTEAQKLYRQLAEGDWQPRFNWVRSQARWQLERK